MNDKIEWIGHILETTRPDSEIYLCGKCKIRLFQEYEGKYFRFDMINLEWSIYNLSCEEQIIKNIIE